MNRITTNRISGLLIATAILLAGCNNAKAPSSTESAAEPSTHQASEHTAQAAPSSIQSTLNDIQNHADKDAITASLYPQMRPHIQITKKDLSTSAVDAATRQYIADKYTPMFIANLGQIFTKMQSNQKDFTDCAKPEAFNAQEDVKEALCLSETDTSATITHFSGFQSAPLEETVTFILKKDTNRFTLVDVKLPTSKPTAYFVEGVS